MSVLPIDDQPEATEQINKLAAYILENVTGEPSKNESAVDTAIRIIDAGMEAFIEKAAEEEMAIAALETTLAQNAKLVAALLNLVVDDRG
jgi:hypothetical protein